MKKLSNLMLISNFICSLFYAFSYPYIYQEVMKVVERTYVSVEQIGSCVGVVVFGMLWNKFGDALYNHYRLTIVAETIADIFLFVYIIVSGNLKIYFILNLLIYALITRNIANGGIRLRAKVHPDEKSRERYDNNCNIVNSIASLLGAVLSLILSLDLNILFVCALIGNIFDNFCYYYTYAILEKK